MGLVGRLDDVVDDEVDVALPVEVALEVRSVEDVVPDEELMPVKVPAIAGFPAVTWTYDAKSGRWHTNDQVMSAASPTNLIFQQVSYKGVQLHHPGGAIVPSAHVFGAGVATVFSGASGITGVWTKPGNTAVTVYADSTGVPLSFRPGVTWVFLIPSGTNVTYS